YSHHATDPCSGRLVNAFDLVRLHKFGDQDDEAAPGTPTNRLPSYTAMSAFALHDAGVAALRNQERYEKAVSVFESDAQSTETEPHDTSWLKLLELSPTTGRPAKTAQNVIVVLNNDPALKGRIYRDTFTDRVMACGPLPWPPRDKSDIISPWS